MEFDSAGLREGECNGQHRRLMIASGELPRASGAPLRAAFEGIMHNIQEIWHSYHCAFFRMVEDSRLPSADCEIKMALIYPGIKDTRA
jgi:hypothetical protein